MFRGFEIILQGKDPQAGLIVTPRICGICGGSHLYKSATRWTPRGVPMCRPTPRWCATSRRRARRCSRIPRYFYALFAIDLTNKNYAKSKLYDEAVRRFAPYVGTSYQPGRGAVGQAGRGVCDLRRPVAALQLHGARRRDVRTRHCPTSQGRSRSSSTGRTTGSRSSGWAARSTAGWTTRRGRTCWSGSMRTRHSTTATADSSSASASTSAWTSTARGVGQLHRHRHVLRAVAVREPDHRRTQRRADRTARGIYRRRQLVTSSTRHASARTSRTPSTREQERCTHSTARPSRSIPKTGRKQGKYSWAKSPRYDVPGRRTHVRSRPVRWPGGWPPAAPNAADTPGQRPAVRRHAQQDRSERVRPSAGTHARSAEVLQVGARMAQPSSTSRRASTPSPSSTPKVRASARQRPPAVRCRTGS